MENQNDASASSIQNMNVKFNIRDLSKFSFYIFHISNFAALLSAILLVLTYGTGSPFQTIRYLFTSLTSIVHASSIFNYLCDISIINKKDQIISTDNNNKPFLNKILICSDVHDLTILLLFSYAGITPILYVFSYIISFLMNFVNSTLNEVIPLLGPICSPQNISNDANSTSESSEEMKSGIISTLDPLKKITNSMTIKILPAIFQIVIAIQLFIITLFDMSFFNILLCIIYVTWEVMFDYSTNAVYNNVWTKIGNKFNELAETNSETFGNILSSLMNSFSKIGQCANKWYK